MEDETDLGEVLNAIQGVENYTDSINDRVYDIIEKTDNILNVSCVIMIGVILAIIWKFVKELLP